MIFPEEKHRCQEIIDHTSQLCGKPTALRGWYFVSHMKKDAKGNSALGRFRKEYHFWCEDHFLINMFNLVPYVCTKTCEKRRAKSIAMPLSSQDSTVWIPLFSGSGKPTCPWCTRPMRVKKIEDGSF